MQHNNDTLRNINKDATKKENIFSKSKPISQESDSSLLRSIAQDPVKGIRNFTAVRRAIKGWILARKGSPIISFLLRPIILRAVRGMLQHTKLPSLPYGLTPDVAVSNDDVELAKRLLGFWHSMTEKEQTTKWKRDHDLWTMIIQSQSNLIQALEQNDPRAVAEYLVKAPTTSICRGILQGDIDSQLLHKSHAYRNVKSRLTIDRYISLLESIGAVSVRNPEQRSSLKGASELDPAALLRELDAFCGIKVLMPQVFSGLFVSYIDSRPFNQVDLMALHAALRIRAVLSPLQDKSILEIGGGSGRVAYWCTSLGLGPIQVIDLPHVAILQAWYLIKALPNKHIHLYGETNHAGPADVSIYPDSAFDEVRKDFTIAFNQDSLPEMSRSAASRYLDWIAESKAKWFLSVNHETAPSYGAHSFQLNPIDLIHKNPGFSLIERQRNWIRSGYVDGLYTVNTA